MSLIIWVSIVSVIAVFVVVMSYIFENIHLQFKRGRTINYFISTLFLLMGVGSLILIQVGKCSLFINSTSIGLCILSGYLFLLTLSMKEYSKD